MPGILSRPRRERITPLKLGGGNEAPLDVGGTLVLPVELIKGSVDFPQGFPTRLSHEAFPQGCPTCHLGLIDPRLEGRGSAGKTGLPGMD